jgi:6-pyruvoyltetrahydropterin/6-carboxytetrahydropterin synthase
MIIRKLFKFEGAHIVRDCSSNRCKKSLHGHSYIVEVFITSRGIDNGGMVMDFGLMKGTIGDLIDSFDHCYSMWSKEKPEFKEFIKAQSERWVEMPVSPSAEMYSLMLFYIISRIIFSTTFNNGENRVSVHSVRVHETATGYAESFVEDMQYWEWGLESIIFSEGVTSEWKDPLMYEKLKENKRNIFINPTIELKYHE